MSEALLDKKFGYWQNQLLDLGKRNKMINYRETKRATLKLIEPEFEELFNRIAVNEEELTFQSPVDKNSDIRAYSVLSLLETLSCPIPVNIGDIKANGSILERQKTLKQMRSKSRLALDEQGTNILYLVSGFVEWKEKNDTSSPWIKSPLILVPVSLVLESINTPYILKKYDDDIVVNPTLAYLFERDYGITLPTFDPDEESLNEFMNSMEKLVDRKGWRVIRENSLGLVSFLKINMYKDLCNNEDNVKSNPIIRAFAGEDSDLDEIPEELYNYNHDSVPSIDRYQVVNADSSQQDAILLSQKGVSFVMQGPPGTGKSQTITNIIAQGLADGKKILFVSEKAAALEVVYKRLSEVHLDDFCLALHNYKANKKEVLDELAKSLELSSIKVKAEETAKLIELDTLKEFLGQYVSDIHEEKMPLEMSLYEVYGALVALDDTIELPLELKSIENMTKDQVNRLGLLVADFDKAKNNLGEQWYKNPWNGTNIVNVTYDLTNQINEKLTHTLHNINCLREEFSNQMLVDYPFIFSPNGYSLTTEYTLAKGTTYLIGALNCGSDNASYTIAFQFKELKESFPESYDTQNEEMSDAKYVELNKRYYAVRAISETADWFKFTVKSEADISVSGDVVDWDVYNSNGAPVNQSTGLKKGTYYVNFHARNANGQYSFIVIDKKAAQNNNKKPNNTVTKPKATYITKLTKGSKRFKVSVKKQSVTGYQVQYSLKSNFKGSKTKSFKGTSYTVKGLKGKKKYYVRVRSYKKSGSKTLYSAWSGKKSVKTNK